MQKFFDAKIAFKMVVQMKTLFQVKIKEMNMREKEP
jgi:hypothetical protein